MSSGRRVVAASALFGALAVLGFFAAAAVSYSPSRVIPSLSMRWEWTEAFLGYFRWLAGLQFLALAVSIGSTEGKTEDLVQGAILPTIVLSALLSAAALLIAPPLEAARSSALAASASFNASLDDARRGLASGDLALARSALTLCQAVSGKDPRVQDLDSRLAAAELKSAKDAVKPAAREAPAPRDPAAAKDYYLKALAFFDKGDFFAANWYASTAMRLDPSYTDARRLAAKAWDSMQSKSPDPADVERAAFYSKKLEGYGLLRAGDPVGAYRVFKELSDARHGDDPDVRRYLAESLAGTEKSAFFKDEAERPLASAAVTDALMRIPEAKADAKTPASATGSGAPERAAGSRILAAKRAALSGGALYFSELEYLETGPSGLRAMVRTPFAKLSGGKLFLVCVERDRPAEVLKPTWAAGPASGPASLVELSLEPEAAYKALSSRSAPASLSAIEAWRSAVEAPRYGIDRTPLVDDLLRRSALPFGVFTASALGALAGGRFRKRGSFDKGLYALVPLMAAALVPVFLLAARVDELISAWSAAMASGLASLAVAAGIRTLALFIAVMLVAGARNVREVARD